MPTLIVGTQIDDNSIRKSSNEIQRRFDRVGQQTGSSFMASFADGAAAASPKIQKAMNTAEDAVGRLRVEQSKLDSLMASGESNRTKIIQQSERVAKARRDEAAAVRKATDAYEEYGQSGGNVLSEFVAGLRSGAGVAGAGGQVADSFAGGFAGAASIARLGAAGGPVGLALAGLVAVGAVAGKQLGDAVSEGMATLQMQDLMQARMGLDEGATAQYAEAAGRAYAANFGTSVQDNLSTAQVALRAGLIDTGSTDAEVQHVVEQLQGLSKVTEGTAGELSRSVTTLMRNGLAGSIAEASDIITAGFQKGLDVSGDWLDAVNEYSTQARKFGLDASEWMTLLKQGFQGGARDVDVVSDALKEFALRAVDGSKTTREGFEGVGLQADEMGRRFAEGGQSARAALNDTFDALKRLEDPQQQQLAWQRLFGTQFQDMGDAVNRFSLDPVKNQFTDMTGAAKKSTDDATENFKSKWDEATRTVEQRFADMKTSLADWITKLPVIRDIPQEIIDLANGQQPGVKDAADLGLYMGPDGKPTTRYRSGGDFSAPMPAIPGHGMHWDNRNGWVLDSTLPAGVVAPTIAPSPPPLLPGGPKRILTDAEAEAAKEAEKAGKAKPNIDPSRYSLDSVPVGALPGLDQGPMPMMAAVAPGAPGVLPQVTWGSGDDPFAKPGYGYRQVDQQKVFDAETSVLSAKGSAESARRRFLELQADADSTQSDLAAARTSAMTAERQYQSALAKLADAQQGTWKKMESTADKFKSGMDDISAGLDQDFGASDGLAGIAENLVKFAASMAAAPLTGQLEAIKQANSSQGGSGLIGIAAAQGAFGPNYTGITQPGYGATGVPSGYAMPGMPAYVPGSMPAGGDVTAAAKRVGTAYSQALRNDCSGMVGQVINDALGIAGGQLPTTKNMQQWLTERGFRPGVGGPGSISVGWYDHGPNPNDGHAAMTLSNGMNFESGGSSGPATIGGSAAGASSPQFDQHMFLPAGGGYNAVAPSVGITPTPISAPSAYQPLTSPALTDPGLTPMPTPTTGGGGWWPDLAAAPAGGGIGTGAGVPGMAAPPAGLLPTGAAPIGSSVIPGQTPVGPPGAGQGMTTGISGIPLAAIQGAASGLDLLMPGAGQAANVGIQLLNRTIGFGASLAGNAVSGLFETLSLSGSGGMTDPMKTLPGRLLAGIAGARPALPNTAGQGQQSQSEQQRQQNPQQDQGQQGGPLVQINGGIHQQPGQTPDSVANSVANQVRSAEASGGYYRR